VNSDRLLTLAQRLEELAGEVIDLRVPGANWSEFSLKRLADIESNLGNWADIIAEAAGREALSERQGG